MIVNDIRNIIIIIFIISIIYFCFLYVYHLSNAFEKVLARKGYQYTNKQFDPTKYSVIDVPDKFKCFLNEDSCEQNNITLFTVCVSVIYFIIGRTFPDHYMIAIFSSIGFQIFRQSIGLGSSFITDPLANITAYTLGSISCPNKCRFAEKYEIVLK